MRWSGGSRGKIGIGGLSLETHTKARSGEIDGVDGGWPTGVGVSGVGEREREIRRPRENFYTDTC